MKLAALFLGLVLGVATAATWDDVTFTRDGKWSLMRGSVSMSMFNGKPAITAAANHTKGDTEAVYAVFVEPGHCDAPYGETTITTLDGGRVVDSIVWTRGRESVGEVLARAVCAAYRRQGRPAG